MSDTSLPETGPARHRLLLGVLGGTVALVAITMAHAALPDPPQTTRPAPPTVAARIVAAVAAAAAPPAMLIAFQAPLPDGEVGSPFGLRQLPWEEKARLHAGEDMVAPAPEPVLAAADGVVTRVGQDPGYGRFVELTHAEGLRTRYGHLDRFAPGLALGTALKAGSPVGRLGSTGTSTGVHLHFEVRDAEDRPLNPAMFVGRAFATRADLPLREARRLPRQVRVAYVSRIPRNKQALMEARLEAAAAAQAGDAPGAAAESASDAAPQEGAPAVAPHRRQGRVHMRFRPHGPG